MPTRFLATEVSRNNGCTCDLALMNHGVFLNIGKRCETHS